MTSSSDMGASGRGTFLHYLESRRELDGIWFPDLVVEYRFACSGEFFSSEPAPGKDPDDWRQTEMSRLLLSSPFELYVASRPFESFPQELCFRLGLRTDWTEQAGGCLEI